MPIPVINYDLRLKRIPTHVIELPDEADSPSRHYERFANDSWGLHEYVGRNLARVNVYPKSRDQHLGRLRNMVLLSLVEGFERFFKEIAATCIDEVGRLILDDRLSEFNLKGDALAAHFDSETMGKAQCESSTWLNCKDINRRFKRILSDPFGEGKIDLFPEKSQRKQLVEIIWQLRHSIVHNAAVITESDALKLRRLTRNPVAGNRVLWPTPGDVWYVKLYLDQTVGQLNEEIGARLAELMTTLHADDPDLFDPGTKAQELANAFQRVTTIGLETRHPA